jgi:hypothetical protein
MYPECRNTEKVVVLVWNLWQSRSTQVWNGNNLNARHVGIKAAQMLEEWATI